MTDIAQLSIRVDALEVAAANRELDKMAAKGKGAELGIAALGKALAALGAGAAVREVFNVNAEFQRLQAMLVTVEGSTGRAGKAFEMLKGLAQTTPYELTEVTQAFIDLKTRGMDASADSMTAYGDMASSFGRSLTDMIRAASGVAMGETEAIKSFGIQAKVQGDKLTMTFKGQSETIARTTEAVEEYITRVSKANFGGGMARQMGTLGGAASNLTDQIKIAMFELGNSGVGDAFAGGLAVASDAVSALTAAIKDNSDELRDLGVAAGIAGSAIQQIAVAMGETAEVASRDVEELGLIKTTLIGIGGIAAAVADSIRGITVGIRNLSITSVEFVSWWLEYQGKATSAVGLKGIGGQMTTAATIGKLGGSEGRKELEADLINMTLATERWYESLDKLGKVQTPAVLRDGPGDSGKGKDKTKTGQGGADSGAIAQANKELQRQRDFIQGLQADLGKLTASEADLLQVRIQQANLVRPAELQAQSLAALITLKKSQAEAEREIAESIKETKKAMEQVMALEPKTAQTFADYQKQRDWDDARNLGSRYTDPSKAAARELGLIQANRDALDPDTYTRAFRALRAEASMAWGVLEDGAMDASRAMSDAFAAWTTGAKVSVRDMTKDILANFARIASNRVFNSLINMGLDALTKVNWGGAGTGGNGNYSGGVPDWWVKNDSVGGAPVPVSTNSVPITVNVTVANSGQATVTTEGAGRMGEALGGAIRSLIADECRPGGMVWEVSRG